MQGFAWERRETVLTGKVLPNCIHLQFYMVHSARVPLLNTNKHLMDLLGILQIRHGSADWLRHERTLTRSSGS